MTESDLAALLAGKALLIFDLDGTLVDSSPLHARAFDTAFAAWAFGVDYPSIAGLTTEAAVDRVLAQHGLNPGADERAVVVREKRAVVRRLIAAELTAIDGASAFVEYAAERYDMALVTSGSRDTVTASLERIGLAGRFHPVITAGDVPSKPDPTGFLRALGSREPGDALIFEDSDSGLAAAAAAGIDAICIVGDTRPASGPALARTSWPPLVAALAGVGA